MPYRVYIDDHHPNIIHNIYSGHITLQDYYDVIEKTYEMIRNTDGTVHTILRYENVTSNPPDVMKVMREASRTLPPNIGLRVVVADTPRAKVAASLAKMGRRLGMALTENIAVVKSIDEAYVAIKNSIA
ncbi:MAG: hypothetical protein AAF787_12800 [Chloroflexota bacterium]